MLEIIKKYQLKIWLLFFLLFLVGLLLIPYIINGLWFDDSLNSQVWAMAERFHTSLWAFSIKVVKAWFPNRIMLSFPIIYYFFYLFHSSVRLIRIADIALLVTHFSVVVYLLRLVRISWSEIGIFLLILVSLFRININDPIAAYATFAQFLGIAMTIALIFLVKWQQTSKALYLVGSSIVVALSLLCYELNIIYVPIAIAIIYTTNHSKTARNLVITLLPCALFIALTIYVRCISGGPYNGSTFGSINLIPVTYLKQLIATFPGSFFFYDRYNITWVISDAIHNKIVWIIAMLALACYILFLQQFKKKVSNTSKGIIGIAAMFLFLPPILIAVSSKYQLSLGWGDAHIPVYYQYFGLAFLLMVASLKIFHWNRAIAFIVIAPVFAIYVALNWTVNMHQVASMDLSFAEPRNSLVMALRSGLLYSVNSGDVVEIIDQPMFVNGNLIYQIVGKNVYIPNEKAIMGWFKSKPVVGARYYRLYRENNVDHRWRLEKNISNVGVAWKKK